MSDLYGCWLDPNFDTSAFLEKLNKARTEYYPFYLRRLEAIAYIAHLFSERMTRDIPQLSGKIHVSHVALMSAVGRYVNDIMHYKLWHDVKVANQAKMIAHTIKWLNHYQVICTTLTPEEYRDLSPGQRKMVLEMNNLFIGNVIRYFLSYFCGGSPPREESYAKMFYLLDTGQFDAKTAAVAFEGLIL